jgi:hypothetical protein
MCLGTIRTLQSAVSVPVHRVPWVPYRTSSPLGEFLDPDLGFAESGSNQKNRSRKKNKKE